MKFNEAWCHLPSCVCSVAGICAPRPHRGHHCCEVHSVQLRVLRQERAGNRAVTLTRGAVVLQNDTQKSACLWCSTNLKGKICQIFLSWVCQNFLSKLVGGSSLEWVGTFRISGTRTAATKLAYSPSHH